MNPKITTFMIAIVLVGFVAASLGLFMGNLADSYGTDYDNGSLNEYNRLAELSEKASQIQNRSSDIKEKSGLLDILGGYFSDAYNVLILSKDTYDTFDDMTDQAINQSNLGQTGTYLKSTITTIVLIVLVLGVFVAAVVKWNI